MVLTVNVDLVGPRNNRIASTVRALDPVRDTLSWFCDWLPHMFDLSGNPLYEDSSWDVPKIWGKLDVIPDTKVLILDARDQIQGYVIVHHNYLDSASGVQTYVPFLAAAPWNRRLGLKEKRQFRDIGKTLLTVASLNGYFYNQDPSLELHSLPAAEGFYRNLKMQDTGRTKNGLREFRLDKHAGYDLLRFLMPLIRQ